MKGEVVIKGPRLVPVGWLVAIMGACGTAITISFAVGVWVATLSAKVEAQGSDVAKLEDVPERMVRVETLLSLAYPNEYRETMRRLPASRGTVGR